MQYTESELSESLSKHRLWTQLGGVGSRADLKWADLVRADLVRADLKGADLEGADLKGADLKEADLQDANLQGADLKDADLKGADLKGADIDYSCWPLWCGSLGVIVDARIARQLAYHFCAVECDDPDYIKARNAILWFANQFHRVSKCGKLKERS